MICCQSECFWLSYNPAAYIDAFSCYSWFFEQGFDHQVGAAVNDGALLDSVGDQLKAVGDRLVDEFFVGNASDKKVYECIGRLLVAERTTKPAHPLVLHGFSV